MICIEKHLLQQYIDHECTAKERELVKQHLSVCAACQHQQLEMEALSNQIKAAIHSLVVDSVEVPVFKNRSVRLKSKNIKLLIYSLSAACILLLVLFIVDKQIEPNPREITIVQSVPIEVDANRPAGDQEFVIEVYDGKGQRSEYLIE